MFQVPRGALIGIRASVHPGDGTVGLRALLSIPSTFATLYGLFMHPASRSGEIDPLHQETEE